MPARRGAARRGAGHMKTLIFAVLFCCVVAMPARANEPAFTLNGWEGWRIYERGVYSHCGAMIYSPASNSTLVLALGRDDSLAILVESDQWRIRSGETIRAEVTIDGKLIAEWIEGTDRRTVRIIYDNPSEADLAYEAIAHGQLLMIRVGRDRFSFRLRTPGQVLDALAKCNDAALAGRAQTRRGGDTRLTKAGRVDQAAAMVHVANLLSAAGIKGQIYLQRLQFPDVLTDADVVWRYDNGAYGSAQYYVNAHRSDLDLVSTDILASEARYCQGNFSSGVREKEEIARNFHKVMVTACETAEGVRNSQYIIELTPAGLLQTIGTVALTVDSEEMVEETSDAVARGMELSF